MRNEVISNAMGTLDQLMFKARDALWDIEREMLSPHVQMGCTNILLIFGRQRSSDFRHRKEE